LKRSLSNPATEKPDGSPIGYDTAAQAAFEALEAERGGRRVAVPPAADPASRSTVAGPGESPTKRRKGDDSAPIRPARLFRMPSNLIPQARTLPAMARVTLRPSVELQEGRIERLVISPGHRTPSPFGSRMGDHTVAWQAVVDAVRALLFGSTVKEAVQAVRERQQELSEWMGKADSSGKKRLILLDDGVRRAERLEDSAYWVTHHLGAADAALKAADTSREDAVKTAQQGKAREGLELAVAYHLAYINYLPYATVPVPSSGGSRGSGEGTYRRVVLAAEAPDAAIDNGADVDDFVADEVSEDVGVDADGDEEESEDEDESEDVGSGETAEEDEGEGSGSQGSQDVSFEGESEGEEEASDDVPVVTVDANTRLRNALWKLFSFEAALRAARTAMALEPGTGDTVAKGHGDLEETVKKILVQLDYNVRPVGSRHASSRLDLTAVDKLSAEAAAMRDRYKGDPDADHLFKLASFVVDTARLIKDTKGTAGPSRTAAKKCRIRLGQLRTPAQAAAETIVDKAEAALPNAAMVLAYLLHDHQLTVALAYPHAVKTSGFLVPADATAAEGEEPAPDHCAAALQQLRREIVARARTLPHTEENLTKLLGEVGKAYGELGAVPEAKNPNGWAAHRAAEALVVTYTPTPATNAQTLTVNGRAPAPRGVAGMGSHTTAWVVEVAAADALAAVRTGVLENFREAVTADLRSDVMRLDCLLPLDQLRGGQLRLLFNTAVQVLEATEIRKAAALYLRFRNLLPYATVDAGSRGGHGEDLAQSSIKLFDTSSLRQAAELHAKTLSDDKERTAVAKDLATLGASLLSRADAAWGNHEALRLAVSACARRLDAQSKALTKEKPEHVTEIILGTRWREHEQTYARAATSRMVINALAQKQAK
jgi:hypothetical protein